MSDLAKTLRADFARILQEQEPKMCATIDQLLRAGQKPRDIQRVIDRQCPKGSLVPGLVNAYLREHDSDFARAEDRREGRA